MNFSIRYKILIAFSFIFIFAMAALIYTTDRIVTRNNKLIINKEMIETRKNLDIYLKQYFLINNMDPTKVALNAEAENIANELSYKIGSKVSLYSEQGELLSDKVEGGEDTYKEDLRAAIDKKTSYSINRIKDTVTVNLCYPILLNDQVIGVLRYVRDYSELYKSSAYIIDMIKFISIFIFFLIFIVSFILSKQITRPITELAKVCNEVSEGNLDKDVSVELKDEVAQLEENFMFMIEKIKSQMIIMEKDRKALKEAENHRKIFFDHVTHELKTPITTILGYSEIIKENGLNEADFFEKGMGHIICEGERLHRLVVELLEYSQASAQDRSYELKPIPLKQLLLGVCEELAINALKYNIEIVTCIPDEIIIQGSEDKLKQVFINIIDNSIKYGAVNSTIFVRALKREDKIEINIEDQGEGIPKEELDHIFQPFYRVDKKSSRRKGGNGLGLSIVKSIVEKHQGKISIISEIDKGTTVNLEFPA